MQQLARVGQMLLAGPVGSLPRPDSYSVHCWRSGAYEPPFPIPENIASRPEAPGSLPGRHLIVEFHEAVGLDNAAFVLQVLRQAAEDAKAQLLALHHHVFIPSGGVTAFAMLAESHISIHTWPIECYAALDIFMCGVCNPLACLPALSMAFRPKRASVLNLTRGLDAID
ncbi:adenosylmethionine decarboxylase [Mesorhizobium huakuii]|uniref:adenosylmethionine decarboxylase n=1 Tax=Mesorhizobium huakuii TaxID=28104 RepID=UPI0038990B91